jgi:hypothetical protein
MNRRLIANDKTLESLTAKMDSLVSSIKDQLNFNKVVESQIAQIAATVPSSVNSCNSLNAVIMRGGKTTRGPPYPNMTRKIARKEKEDEEDKEEEVEESPSKEETTKFHGKTAPHEFYDTNILLPFPRTRKQSSDE